LYAILSTLDPLEALKKGASIVIIIWSDLFQEIPMNHDIEAYYAQRAAEYDRIYEKPERQSDLAELKANLSTRFNGLDVLEIACGTGYWTQYIAKTARSITATDYNAEMLIMAAERDYSNCQISFHTANAFSMPEIALGYQAGFAGFLWSHIPLSRRIELIESYHSHLAEDAQAIWIDNLYVEGSSTPISRQDSQGNTYQIRLLTNGSRHEVIKNYSSENALKNDFAAYAENIEVTLFHYFWMLSYKVKTIPKVKPDKPPLKTHQGSLINE
jgi:SAM-dependent methyltransferase